MSTETSTTDAANRFIDFYGRDGILYGKNVTDFLTSIAMSTAFHSRIEYIKSECPNRPELRYLTWTKANASSLVSLVLDGVQTPACYGPQKRSMLQSEEGHKGDYNPAHVWGYGLLFVTLINLCACVGIIFLPCMGRRVYKLLMSFMVSLAVGSLLSTALLILLPESLQLLFIHEEVKKANSSLIEKHHHHVLHTQHDHSTWEDFLTTHPWYLWRCCTVFGGIYMFFIIERLLKELIRWKDKHFSKYTDLTIGGSDHHNHSHLPSSAVAVSPTDSEATDLANFRTAEIRTETSEVVVEGASASALITESGEALVMPQKPNGSYCGGASRTGMSVSNRLAAVQPVAWMILLGDALHNFIDGLSIGAAFTRSTLSGVSICLAVLCEELPHELGDFAILLSAGMSMPMALLCNFLSACTCYLGFALGVLLGETGASIWVFAIATGMFLYISLVDMTPEVNQAMEDPDAKHLGRAKIFLLQNLGLFTGFGIILLLAVYGGNISVG